MCSLVLLFFSFFFNDTATTEIYTLSLHDALPIFVAVRRRQLHELSRPPRKLPCEDRSSQGSLRSEEHTSELQSPDHLVCRLLLEKKKSATLYFKTSQFNLIQMTDGNDNRLLMPTT